MSRFGGYEIVREIFRGPTRAVFVARDVLGEARFTVKVIEPDPPAPEFVERWLHAARTQGDLARGGGDAWAPVYAANPVPGGAWRVTDLYERSVEKLILHRRELDSADLSHLARAVVQALRELWAFAGRAHGHLTPSNVVIAGDAVLTSSRVLLTDLTPMSDPEPDPADDRRQLGELLFQVVMHRPRDANDPWPIPVTVEWRRLGREAPAWARFTSRLLDPSGPPALDEVQAQIPPPPDTDRFTRTVADDLTVTVPEDPDETPLPGAAPANPEPVDDAYSRYAQQRKSQRAARHGALLVGGALLIGVAGVIAWTTGQRAKRAARAGPEPTGKHVARADPPPEPPGPRPPSAASGTNPGAESPTEPDVVIPADPTTEPTHPAGSSEDPGPSPAATDGPAPDPQAASAEEAARAARETQRLRVTVSDLAALLDVAQLPLEPFDDGTTIERLAENLRADRAFETIADDPSFLALESRLARLRALASETDLRALQSAASEAAAHNDGVALRLAWRRLTGPPPPNWPTSPADVEAFADLTDRALPVFAALARYQPGRVGSETDLRERAGNLQEQTRAGAQRVWIAAAEALTRRLASDPAAARDWLAVMKLRPRFGFTDEPPLSDRFNHAVLTARDRFQGLSERAPDADVRAAAREFAADLARLGPASPGEPRLAAALAWTREIAGGSTPAPVPVDFAQIGPGARQWRAAPAADRSKVVYSAPWTPRALEFVRAEAEGRSSYVLTTEVPLGLVIDAVEHADAWGDFLTLMPEHARDGNKSWEGPRVWGRQTVPTLKLQPSREEAGNKSAGWLQSTPKMRAVDVYPPGVTVPPPGADHPMQQITAPAAIYAASILGCRLLTSSEWRAAEAAESASAGAPTPNRRDRSWASVLDVAQQNNARNLAPKFPDGGIFENESLKFGQFVAATVDAQAGDDGVVWFARVSDRSGVRVHHLIGNVAEFVDDGPRVGGAPAMTPDAARARAAAPGAIKVIGGSALSPPEIDPRVGYPPRAAGLETQGYSDVGFRLAFSADAAPVEALAQRARREVLALPLIPPSER